MKKTVCLNTMIMPVYTQKKRDTSLSIPLIIYKVYSLLLKSCVSCCKASDRHAEWRAAYIVKACEVAELY